TWPGAGRWRAGIGRRGSPRSTTSASRTGRGDEVSSSSGDRPRGGATGRPAGRTPVAGGGARPSDRRALAMRPPEDRSRVVRLTEGRAGHGRGRGGGAAGAAPGGGGLFGLGAQPQGRG